MYAMGQGVAQDYALGLVWYRKAADQGVPAAQYNVGLIYANGLGVTADHAEARLWMEKAAAGGHGQAKAWLEANQPK
jgi:TPR repeat protein